MKGCKKTILLFITVMGLFFLTGCDKFSFDIFNSSQEDGDLITLAPTEEAEPENGSGDADTSQGPGDKAGDEDAASGNAGVEATATPAALQPAETVDLQIYTVNTTEGVTEPMTAAVPKNTAITPELIVDNVVEAMADRSLDVGIQSITTDKDAIIVDFDKNKAPLDEAGSIYENAILDAIAMSLMDNLADYSKVIYHVEGKAYTGSHIELKLNEPYLTR